MATRTIANAGGNYNATTTWVEGAVPTAADDIVATGTSGQLTINVASACRSADFTGYVSALTHAAAVTWSIGTSTVNGTVALKFVAGMTYTLGSQTSSVLSFVSTSTTQIQITAAAKTLANVTFNGVGGSWLLADGFTQASASSIVTLTNGTLNTNGQTCSWGLFASSNANTRVLTLGASSITLSGAATTVWNVATSTGFTFNANTSTITMTGANAALAGGGLTYNNVALTGSGAAQVSGASTFANLTRTGTAVKTDGLLLQAFGATQTVTGTLTLTGNSPTNRLLVQSNTIGSNSTINAATVSLTNVDFMDITGAGVASPFTGTSLGNALGNSGITFTGAVTRYAVVTGNWSASAMWASTSGGAGGASVPLPQDAVIFDANSGASCTADMPRLGKDITCTAFTGSLSFTGVTHTQYGNLTLGSGMTFFSSQPHVFAGRGAQTITSAGKAFGSFVGVTVAAPGGTYTLQDALALNANSTLTLSNGTLDANGNNVSAGTVISTGTATRVLKLGSGTWTLTGTGGTIWQLASTGLTFTSSTSTVAITDTGASQKTFHGGGLVYNNLTLSGRGIVSIAEANTFNVVTVGAQQQVIWPASFTTTLASLVASGQNNGYLALPGVATNYVSTPDSAATSPTGNFTLDVDTALTTWASASVSQILVSKWPAAGNFAFEFYVNISNGKLVLAVTSNGTTVTTFASSVAPGFTAGTRQHVRASLALTNGTNSVCQFFTSTDGVAWTQLGTDQTNPILTGIFDSTGVLEIGSNGIGAGSLAAGNFYEVKLYNSALGSGSGTPVFDADFTTKAFGANSFTESSTNAATVSINGTVAQLGDGRLSMVSSTGGTQATISQASGMVNADYLVLQDNKVLGGATFNAGSHSVDSGNNTGWSFTSPAVFLTPSAAASTAATGAISAPTLLTLSAGASTSATVTLTAPSQIAPTASSASAGAASATAPSALAPTAAAATSASAPVTAPSVLTPTATASASASVTATAASVLTPVAAGASAATGSVSASSVPTLSPTATTATSASAPVTAPAQVAPVASAASASTSTLKVAGQLAPAASAATAASAPVTVPVGLTPTATTSTSSTNALTAAARISPSAAASTSATGAISGTALIVPTASSASAASASVFAAGQLTPSAAAATSATVALTVPQGLIGSAAGATTATALVTAAAQLSPTAQTSTAATLSITFPSRITVVVLGDRPAAMVRVGDY